MNGGTPQDHWESRYAARLAEQVAALAEQTADPGTELGFALPPYHTADWAQGTACLRE
jgi:hypothetical protein